MKFSFNIHIRLFNKYSYIAWNSNLFFPKYVASEIKEKNVYIYIYIYMYIIKQDNIILEKYVILYGIIMKWFLDEICHNIVFYPFDYRNSMSLSILHVLYFSNATDFFFILELFATIARDTFVIFRSVTVCKLLLFRLLFRHQIYIWYELTRDKWKPLIIADFFQYRFSSILF